MTDIKIDDKTVAFISDWRKRSEEQQKKITILFVTILLAVFLFSILAFSGFQYKNYDRIVEQNMNYVQDSAIQESNQIEQEMLHAKESVISLAARYMTLTDNYIGESVEDRLILLSDKSIFDRIAYVKPDGMDISLEGNADVHDREYFKNAMDGKAGWDLIEKSRVTGRPAVVFYAPVYSGDTIVGVMSGFFERSRLDDMFTYQMFNYVPNSYLLLGDGTVVANSGKEKMNANLLEELSGKMFVGETDYEKIKEMIAAPDRTTVTFAYRDGNQTMVGVIVQFIENDWMLLSILPNDITEKMLTGANRTGMMLLFTICAVFAFVVAAVTVFLTRQRKRLEGEMAIATENLEMSVKNDQRQYSIIQSLADIFSGVYYVDLVKSEYTRLREKEGNVTGIPDSGDMVKGFSAYVENFISEEYLDKMRTFLDANTFKQRIEKNGMMVTEYQRADKGWRRGTLIPTARNEEGDILSLLYAVQVIDQEKKKEYEAREALQEAYEAVQMANSAKTTFLSNMSHDIRTPLNAIIGMTTIAAAHLDNADRVSDCLKNITSSGKHLLGLINEVLDMSKIESGKVDFSEEEFSLSELVDNLISIHQSLIREKNHALVVKVKNLEHEKVIGDSTRLQQVFANLLSNAIKYTPAGGRIEIEVSEKNTNKPTVGWYEVVFRDNGIGMSEEYQQTIFEPFTRAKDNRLTTIQGTGLGMSIAKNIIRMMGGDITVESRINEGSVFTVSFVLKLQAENEINYDKFVDLPVLVVDDDAAACESTCTILNDLSMNSEWVTTGKEAVEKTAAHHEEGNDYYAVILDWKMPDMDGLETTREIRRCVGEDIPVIVMSAYDWSDIEQEAKEAGVNIFLSKPLFKSKVINLFEGLLGEQDGTEADSPAAALDKYDFSGKRILLVEDNELNREIAAEILQMAGFEIETAEDGKISVDKFAESSPGYYDLILMDIRMPVMDGYEATKTIRASNHPDAQKIPIIAMTANAFSSDVRDAINAGMNGHIAKPIDVDRVLKVLEENLGR